VTDDPDSPRHPADARALRPIAFPPNAGPPTRISDVLLVPTDRNRGSFEEYQAHPPVGNPPFELGRGLQIAALDPALCELIFNACDPRGHFHFSARGDPLPLRISR
jgi:hypothetical protein